MTRRGLPFHLVETEPTSGRMVAPSPRISSAAGERWPLRPRCHKPPRPAGTSLVLAPVGGGGFRASPPSPTRKGGDRTWRLAASRRPRQGDGGFPHRGVCSSAARTASRARPAACCRLGVGCSSAPTTAAPSPGSGCAGPCARGSGRLGPAPGNGIPTGAGSTLPHAGRRVKPLRYGARGEVLARPGMLGATE